MTFDKKMIIQKYSIIQDNIGNDERKWNDVYSVWVSVNGLYGAEYYAAASYNQEDIITFTMRWFKALDEIRLTDCRIVFMNKIYEIKNVDNVKYENKIVKIKAVCRHD